MADLKTTNIYGDAYINNKVGIATNAPATRLQIGQLSPTAATEGIQFGDDTSTRIYRGGSGQINFNGTINVLGNTYLGDANGDTVYVNDTIRIGATDSGDASLFFGEGSVAGSDYGAKWYWDSGYTFTWYTRNAGTDTSLFDYVTNDTTYLNWRRHFHMQNKEINYNAQIHFNAGTRFVGQDTNYLVFRSDSTSVGGIRVQDGGIATKGYIGYWDSSGGGILNNTGNWALRYNFGSANSGGTLFGTWVVDSTNDGILTINKSSGTGWGYINFSQAGTRRFYFGLNGSFEPELGVDNGGTFRVVGGMTVAGNAVLTSTSTLTAGNLSGTIPSGVLGNSTHYVGTTAIALNRASAGQTLTGISIDGNSGGIYAAGQAFIQTTSVGTSYVQHIQVREAAGGSGLTSETYAPALGFHWAGIVASNILMEASGRISIRNNPGTGYENFIAATITAGTSFSGAGTGLTGTAAGLSIGGNAATATTAANGGVTSISAGTGIGTSASTGAVTITNNGVTSALAGTGVGVSGATGAVTFSIGQAVGTANSPTFATLQLTRLNFGATGAPYATAAGEGFGNGITFGGDENNAAYRIFTGMENIGGNYSKLTFNWHTGIRLGAAYQYGGIRFYNNYVGAGTEIFSVGNLDSNVRVVNSLIVNGNIGIGTTSPGTKLHVYNSAAVDTLLESGTSGTTGKLIFKTSDNADLNKYIMQESFYMILNGHANEGFKFRDSNGNVLLSIFGAQNAYASRVGIGTITPSYKLDVNGTGRFSGDLTVTSTITAGTSFSGPGTGLTGTAASLTVGAVTNGLYTTGGQTIAGITYFSNGESINAYGIRGRFTNEYLHLYNKVGIGSPNGWGQGETSTPNYGLSTYGGLNIAYGDNGISTFNGVIRANSNIRQGADLAMPLSSWSVGGTSTGMVIFSFPGNTGNYGMVHCVFDIYEYNSNTVSTVIVGGHNWNGAWYNTGANVIGRCGKSVRLGVKDSKYCVVFGGAASSWEYGTIVLRKIHNGGFYTGVMDMGGSFTTQQTATESFSNISGDLRVLRTSTDFIADGGISGTTGTFSSDLSIAGQYQIRNSEPTITLRDTDHRTAFIHVNSNIFYVLTGVTDSAKGNWATVANGRWPMELNLSNNNATFGADVNAISFTGAGTGLTGTAASLTAGAVTNGVYTNTNNSLTAITTINNTSNTVINTLSGNLGLTMFQATAGTDAYMAFHIGSDYAAYFGLGGAENDLVYGGWSVGNVRHRILHSGNATYAWNMNQYVRTTDSPTFNTVTANITGNAYNNLSNNYKDIYVYGDVNTYYVVLINGESLYSFGRYSVTRGYNWTGPDTWNNASHKGGLTLDWEWSGDTAWGGNDKAIRIIEFNESYSTMVAGLGYPVNGGVLIWLRGGGVGGALYRIRTPVGSNSTVTIYDNLSIAGHVASTTFTAANSAVFSTRANTNSVSAEILARYPVRDSGGLYVDNNAVLHAGNYNSYSPTLTGTGASGTWGISVTGNAVTAGGLAVHAGTNNEANKIVRTDGNGYINAGWINTPSGDMPDTQSINRIYCSDDQYIRYKGVADFKQQIGLTYKNATPRSSNTTDTNYWTGMMGWGTTDFNTMITWGCGFIESWSSPGNSPGAGYSHFVGVQALHYTNGDTDGTDNYGYQLVAGGGVNSPLFLRVNWGSAGSWKTMLDSLNFNSYSPSLTGNGASGTWSINITGNAGTATSATSATSATTATNGFSVKPGWAGAQNLIADLANFNNSVPSGFYQYSGATNSPSATWYNLINVRHSNTGNDHGFQLAMSYYDNNLWFRSYQGGTGANNGTFQSWAKTLSDQNYTDYTVTKTGTGASGTWAINITGNAATATNGGVTSISSGVGIGTSAGTGAVTITNTSPNATHTGDVTGATALTIANSVVTNAKLANSSVTIGSTAVSLGGTVTTFAGLVSVTSTTFVGALTGNASTATALTSMNISQFTNNSGYLTSVTNISGNAATVTNATFYRQFTVRDDRSDGGDYSLAARATGLYAITGVGTSGPGSSYSSLIHVSNGTDVAFQIAGGYNSDAMYFRGTSALQSGTGYSAWRTVIHNGNIGSQTVSTAGSCTGNAATATNVAASGITGQTGMWTSAARPGPYRLYRRDSDDDYSVQNYWTGVYWRLDGYHSNNTLHAGCSVSYADTAGVAGSVSALGIKTGQLDDNIVTFAKMQQVTGPVAVGKLSAGLGNLTTVDIHAGVNNEANKLVRTQANGFVDFGWINTISGDNGTTALDRIYASGDAYIRYYTPANFRTVLDVPTRNGTGVTNFGINTAPSNRLHINGDNSNPAIRVDNGAVVLAASVASNGRGFYGWLPISIGGTTKWIQLYNT